ncbi:MAG TPA: alpha/beta fold hydrolase, partial [Nakamurella multipartita]|nr:alpha/beta fold hydrolase [Nakamurella multipartita]
MTRESAALPAVTPRPGAGRSPDGTRLGWWSVGSGPGLLVVHGAMQSGLSQLDLARELAGTRTVHLLDRRGRGRSGPWPDGGFDVSAEVADVIAAARATGSADVLGISSGAILALRAALTDPGIERVAAFEPPIAVAGSIRMDQI